MLASDPFKTQGPDGFFARSRVAASACRELDEPERDDEDSAETGAAGFVGEPPLMGGATSGVMLAWKRGGGSLPLRLPIALPVPPPGAPTGAIENMPPFWLPDVGVMWPGVGGTLRLCFMCA